MVGIGHRIGRNPITYARSRQPSISAEDRIELTWESDCDDKCDYKVGGRRSKQDLSEAKSLASTSYGSSLINSPGHSYFVK
jgi:hypothetical protein